MNCNTSHIIISFLPNLDLVLSNLNDTNHRCFVLCTYRVSMLLVMVCGKYNKDIDPNCKTRTVDNKILRFSGNSVIIFRILATESFYLGKCSKKRFSILLDNVNSKIQNATQNKNIMETENKCNSVTAETRQIIRYRATATFRRPKIKQYKSSKEGRGYKTKRNII